MNRRNFVLGLGTAATLSGAASVTSAAFASTTTVDNTDFRVFAQASLEANGTYTDDDNVTNGTGVNIVNASGNNEIDFSGVDSGNFNSDLPLATAGGSTTTNDLSVELAFTRTASGRKDGVLTINNTGATEENVGIVFQSDDSTAGFGSDVDDGTISAQNVVDTITFEALDDTDTETVISPTSVNGSSDSDQSPANRVTVPAGGEKQVDINLDATTAFQNEVEGNVSASGGNPFDSGGVGSLDLVDAILIGTGTN